MQSNLNLNNQGEYQSLTPSANVSMGVGSVSDQEMIESSNNVDSTFDINSLIDKLIIDACDIAFKIESKYEPVGSIESLNQHLQNNHQAIWHFISQPENISKKKDFYAKVFKGVTDKMLNEKLLSAPTYLPQILRFFRNVLVNFFPNDIEDENLAEVVHSIFNLDAYLYTQALQQSQRKIGSNESGDGIESLDQQRVIQEHEWRTTLKIGDKVDAIKLKHQQQYRIQGWAKGEIIKFLNDNSDTFLIQFENEPPSLNIISNRFGHQLAPPGAFTDDSQWREELQPGQLLDCLDSENVWYRSTVLDLRQVEQNDGRKINQVYVGFRVYDEEEGHKVDDDGKKFVGWSNRYDEWRNISCVTVQRYQSLVKYYKTAGRSFMIYDQSIDDLTDIIQNTKQRKIWALYRPNIFSNLRCIADYLNEFGIRGGFDKILKFMSITDETRKVSLKHIQYLMDFLSKGSALWHRQFAVSYVPTLKIVLERLLQYNNSLNNGPLQMQFHKETLTACQKAHQTILKRFYTLEMNGIIQSELQFSIGFSLLNSDKLEKRIQGIKEISEQIKNSKFQMKKMMSTQEIISRIKSENFCEKIFGENYHIQLIQRSSEILKFLIQERQFGPQEIEYMWSATKRDQQTKIEIYKIIQETATNYKGEEQDCLIDKFSQIDAGEFMEKEIECVYELTKFIYKQNNQSLKAAQLFWNIATKSKPYKKQIIELAIDKFIDLIRNWDRENKGEYILLCIENIKEHNLHSALQSIKILSKLLDQIPTFKQNNQATLYESANSLIDNFKLFDLLVEDILMYQKLANDLWSKNIINKDNIDSVELLDLPFTHRTQMYFRLNFIRQLLQNSQKQMQQDHLDLLWEQLLVNTQISLDSDIFFQWLKSMLTDVQIKITQDVMVHFFKEKICSDKVHFTGIKKNGFECIQTMFLQINEYQDKLIIQQSNNFNNNNNNVGIGQGQMGNSMPQNQNNNKVEFKIHVHPRELEGIDVLWRMLEDIDKKSVDLVPQIIILITKVYLNLSSIIEDQIHEIGEQFTQECLRRFISIAQNESISFEDKLAIAKYLVMMMKSFFEDSEKNGTGNLRPHIAIDKGDFIQRIVITNNITSLKTCPKYIEINTYSNMTLWELKKIISAKTKTSPLKIQINRSDSKKRQLTDNDHIKLLRDLKIDNNETLTASKKQTVFISKVALVNKRKELVPEAKKIFESWFETFSTPEGFMTNDTCVEFIKNSTSDPNVTTSDQRVQKLFDEFDQDKDGKLSKAEFLEFYRDRAASRPELVWSNLTAHHYGSDLKPISFGQYAEDDIYELKDQTLLTRYKLSNDQESFKILFELLNRGFEEVWVLISVLRVNPHIYANVLTQDESLWSLDKESIYKQLYNLQIIEQFLNEYQIKRLSEVKSYYIDHINNNDGYPSLPDQNVGPQSGFNSGNAAMPVPATNSNVNMPKGDNIPDAPPIGFGPLPPPNMQINQNQGRDKIFDTLDNFQGSIIQEDLSNDIFNEEELSLVLQATGKQINNFDIAKQEWLPSFLGKRGLDLLVSILKNMIDSCQNKKGEDILKSKYEKELVITVVRLIKIITMSTFCANSPNQELTMQLQRRISTVVEEDQVSPQHEQQKTEDVDNQNNQQLQQQPQSQQQQQEDNAQKSKLQFEQEQTTKAYQPLISLLMGEIGQTIFKNLDFQQFQELVIQVILLILNKEKQISQDDRGIIDQGMGLWISLIVFNPELFAQIQKPIQIEEDIEKNTIKQTNIAIILLEKGLLCTQYQVRNAFKDAFLFISKQVKKVSNSEIPQYYFLKLLLSYLDNVLAKNNSTTQFFDLLKALMDMYFESKVKFPLLFQEIFDPHSLIKDLIFKLHNYISNEKKGAFSDDPNLSGMIQIINMLIQNNQNILSEQQYFELLQEILESLLFSFNLQSINQHITKEIQLAIFEKPYLNKCQSQQSRQAAYNLLNTICVQHPQFIGEIISKYWQPLIGHIKKPKKQGYAPRFDGRASNGYSGIRNLGCICYMNSMIQQFFNIPAFRYGIMAADDKQEIKLKDFEGDQVDDSLLHQLMKYMSFLELSERQDYNPREFCFAFKDFDNQPTNVRIQQDAQEFLNVVFDRIEYQLKGTSQKYLLQNIFGGKTCSLMICKSCGNLKQRQEDFYNITVEVKNQKSIYDGLKKFITGEIINDFQCEACNNRVDVERKTVIEQLPNMLILHLQRIIFDFDSLQNQKLNSRVEFPNVLNMKPFMLSEVLKQEKELMKLARKEKRKQQNQESSSDQQQQQKMEDGKDDEDGQVKNNKSPEKKNQQVQEDNMTSEEEEDDEIQNDKDQNMKDQEADSDDKYEYKLVGVVLHMGTADAGHYLSYININREQKAESNPEWLKTEKDKWLEFNDSQVKVYTFSDLEEDCFGGVQNVMGSSGDFKNDYSRNAYMLVYEKRVKEKIKIVIPQDLLQKNNSNLSQSQLSLDCDGTAISRAQQQQQEQQQQQIQQINLNSDISHLIYICPQILEQIQTQKDIYIDHDKNETIALVDFNSIQKFVPNSYYKMVHDDNSVFLYERHIFNNTFFECTKQLIDLVIQQVPQLLLTEPYSEKLYTFIEKLIFDVVAMTTDNKQLLNLTDLMINMLRKNYDYTLKFIQERILSFNNEVVQVEGEKKEEKKQIRGIFDLLCTNLEKDVRVMAQYFLVFTINKLFDMDRKDLLDIIIDYALSLIPDEISKNWLKMNEYFGLFSQIVASGPTQMQYLIDKGIVSKFIDFFLENESPKAVGMSRRAQMGSNYANPPFDNLINVVVYIGRSMPRIYNTLQLNPVLDYKTQIMQLNTFNRPSPYFFYIIKGISFILGSDDVYMMNLKQFYAKAIKLNMQTMTLAQLIGHVSYENPEFSQRIAKKILIGINQCNGDEIKPYLDSVAPFLYNPDSLMQQRFEWVLGVPMLRIEKPQQNYNMMPLAMNNFKAGVAIYSQMNDDVYEYKSTLFKNSNSIKESLLQILFQYRKRWTLYTLQTLQTLFSISSNDPEKRLLKYMIAMEPPNYSFARYIDWIKPYLEDTIMQASRTPSMHNSKMEISIATLVRISLFQQLEMIRLQQNEIPQQIAQEDSLNQQQDQQINQDINQQQNVQQNEQNLNEQSDNGPKILTHDSQKDGGPEQYLIWNIQQERLLSSKQLQEHNITINVYEYTTYVSESRPTGTGNLVLANKNNNNHNQNQPQNQNQRQNNNNNNNNNNRGNVSNHTIHHPYGRGSGSGGNFQGGDSILGSQAKKRGRKNDQSRQGGNKKVKGKKTIQSNPQQEQDGAFGFQNDDNSNNIDGVTISDVPMADEENYENKFHIVSDEGEEGEYEEEDIGGYENTNEGSNNSHIQGGVNFKEDTRDDFNPNNNQMVDQDFPQQEQSNNNGSGGIVPQIVQREEIEGYDYWQASNATIMLFNIINNDLMKSSKVIITFRDLSEPGQKINFKMPVSQIPCQVNSNREKDAIILTKLRPLDSWGAFDFDVHVDYPRAKNISFANIGAANNNNNSNMSGGGAAVGVSAAAGMDIGPDNGEYKGDIDHKECPQCTYYNSPTASICQICTGNLP